MTSDGLGTNEIMRRTGKSKPCVWRWQERFVDEGDDGLLRDKTRLSRIAPLGEGHSSSWRGPKETASRGDALDAAMMAEAGESARPSAAYGGRASTASERNIQSLERPAVRGKVADIVGL